MEFVVQQPTLSVVVPKELDSCLALRPPKISDQVRNTGASINAYFFMRTQEYFNKMVTSENIKKKHSFYPIGFLTSERAGLSALAEAVSLHSEEAVLVVI